MSASVIVERIKLYACQNRLEELMALKEITQEIALMALSRSGFFKVAAFNGGTSLRILYHLPRFSEDLDFSLHHSDPHFVWKNHLKNMQEELAIYGYQIEILDKSNLNSNIKKAFLKENSIGGFLILNDSSKTHSQEKLKIKFEVDINPPMGAKMESKILDFPLPFEISCYELPSNFAGKCHALLCRKYVKGRDWFDFLWYVSKKVPINFELLTHAIAQYGPWASQNIDITPMWFFSQLREKIKHIDWKIAKQDVMRFLKPRDVKTLDVWNETFFLHILEKLVDYAD